MELGRLFSAAEATERVFLFPGNSPRNFRAVSQSQLLHSTFSSTTKNEDNKATTKCENENLDHPIIWNQVLVKGASYEGNPALKVDIYIDARPPVPLDLPTEMGRSGTGRSPPGDHTAPPGQTQSKFIQISTCNKVVELEIGAQTSAFRNVELLNYA